MSLDENKDKKSYRLIPSEKHSVLKVPTALANVDKKVYEEPVNYQCEWEDCASTFEKLNPFLSHVSEHVSDIPIISTKGTN